MKLCCFVVVLLLSCCCLVVVLLLSCCCLVVLSCCCLVVVLLLSCCCLVVVLLLSCCCLVVLLLSCCLVVVLLLSCCCLVVVLLLSCCCLVVVLLLFCYCFVQNVPFIRYRNSKGATSFMIKLFICYWYCTNRKMIGILMQKYQVISDKCSFYIDNVHIDGSNQKIIIDYLSVKQHRGQYKFWLFFYCLIFRSFTSSLSDKRLSDKKNCPPP